MKHCAQHPVNEEFSLCGNDENEQTLETEFTFVVSGKAKIDCEDCLRIIAEIHQMYTKSGWLK